MPSASGVGLQGFSLAPLVARELRVLVVEPLGRRRAVAPAQARGMSTPRLGTRGTPPVPAEVGIMPTRGPQDDEPPRSASHRGEPSLVFFPETGEARKVAGASPSSVGKSGRMTPLGTMLAASTGDYRFSSRRQLHGHCRHGS